MPLPYAIPAGYSLPPASSSDAGLFRLTATNTGQVGDLVLLTRASNGSAYAMIIYADRSGDEMLLINLTDTNPVQAVSAAPDPDGGVGRFLFAHQLQDGTVEVFRIQWSGNSVWSTQSEGVIQGATTVLGRYGVSIGEYGLGSGRALAYQGPAEKIMGTDYARAYVATAPSFGNWGAGSSLSSGGEENWSGVALGKDNNNSTVVYYYNFTIQQLWWQYFNGTSWTGVGGNTKLWSSTPYVTSRPATSPSVTFSYMAIVDSSDDLYVYRHTTTGANYHDSALNGANGVEEYPDTQAVNSPLAGVVVINQNEPHVFWVDETTGAIYYRRHDGSTWDQIGSWDATVGIGILTNVDSRFFVGTPDYLGSVVLLAYDNTFNEIDLNPGTTVVAPAATAVMGVPTATLVTAFDQFLAAPSVTTSLVGPTPGASPGPVTVVAPAATASLSVVAPAQINKSIRVPAARVMALNVGNANPSGDMLLEPSPVPLAASVADPALAMGPVTIVAQAASWSVSVQQPAQIDRTQHPDSVTISTSVGTPSLGGVLPASDVPSTSFVVPQPLLNRTLEVTQVATATFEVGEPGVGLSLLLPQDIPLTVQVAPPSVGYFEPDKQYGNFGYGLETYIGHSRVVPEETRTYAEHQYGAFEYVGTSRRGRVKLTSAVTSDLAVGVPIMTLSATMDIDANAFLVKVGAVRGERKRQLEVVTQLRKL